MALYDPTFENINDLVNKSFTEKGALDNPKNTNSLFNKSFGYAITHLTAYGWHGETICYLFLRKIDEFLRDGTIKIQDNKILYRNLDGYEEITLCPSLTGAKAFHDSIYLILLIWKKGFMIKFVALCFSFFTRTKLVIAILLFALLYNCTFLF
ncbi:MAG: hypothetical protein ACLTZT_01775 [Butyricimonas faecalis]